MEFLTKYSLLISSLPEPLSGLDVICPDDHRLDEFELAVSILSELFDQKFSYLRFHLGKLPYPCMDRLVKFVDLSYLLECAQFLCLPTNLTDKITETLNLGNHPLFRILPKSKWKHEYPWTSEDLWNWAEVGDLDGLKYASEIIGGKWGRFGEWTCELAAENEHAECLKYAHEHGCPWNERTCKSAVENGHLECLKYAHEHGCPWNRRTCELAANSGHLEYLKYAHENGCPWDKETCSGAANSGHLECLRYAHEHGCPWDELTCSSAAWRGSLECLRYAHENGCPWDVLTCTWTSHSGSLKCLRYAHENGCPWDAETCIWASHNGHQDCLTYARQNGCPEE